MRLDRSLSSRNGSRMRFLDTRVVPTQLLWSGRGPLDLPTTSTYHGRNQIQITAMDFSLRTRAPSPGGQSLYSLVSPDVHTLASKRIDEKTVDTWVYDSKVSGQQERLPVAASLMSASGLDYELITFARRFLEKRDLPAAVETGREMLGPSPTKREQELNPPTYGLRRISS